MLSDLSDFWLPMCWYNFPIFSPNASAPQALFYMSSKIQDWEQDWLSNRTNAHQNIKRIFGQNALSENLNVHV
jgi:hypothetical protein